MTAVSTIPLEISAEAAQHIEQLGLQEPLQRMLDEIPRRIQAIQWIKVGLEHIVDEANRPVISVDVARVHPDGDDSSGRQFRRWVTETFATEIWEHFGFMNIYVDAHER